METPLLLIHFNRPEITRRAIEELKAISPSRLWILCDGPRADRPEDKNKVDQVRQLLDSIPWPCEVKRLYRESNLGCFRNISSGISWFLEDCEEGIILEDDCLASPGFFPFCTELLERYRTDPAIFAISGYNRLPEYMDNESDYLFLNHFECWGWATWKTAWSHFDPDMTAWKDRAMWNEVCGRVFPKFRQRFYWDMMFGKVDKGHRDSWAYRYYLSIIGNNGKTIMPATNLTENIGFGVEATHTRNPGLPRIKAGTISFPLRHPADRNPSIEVDNWLEDHIYSKSLVNRLKWMFSLMRQHQAIEQD